MAVFGGGLRILGSFIPLPAAFGWDTWRLGAGVFVLGLAAFEAGFVAAGATGPAHPRQTGAGARITR
jgi:hypothetical protein